MISKVRLMSIISAVCMVLSILLVGGCSTQDKKVLNGSITFGTTNVYATVEGKIEGAETNSTLQTLNLETDLDVSTDPLKSNIASWSNNALTFTSSNRIDMTITVTNLSTERDLYVTVTDQTEASNLTKDLDFTSGTEVKIEAGTESIKNSKTFTITLNVTTMSETIDGNYGFKVDLRDEKSNADPEFEPTMLTYGEYEGVYDSSVGGCWGADGLIYELNAENKTASILDGYERFTGTRFVFPTQVTDGTEVYNVVSIGGYLFGSERIEYLEIPSSITNVDPFVFNGATIGTLVVKSIIPPANSIATLKQNIGAIYVPDDSVNLYKNDDDWSEYADIIKPLSEKPEEDTNADPEFEPTMLTYGEYEGVYDCSVGNWGADGLIYELNAENKTASILDGYERFTGTRFVFPTQVTDGTEVYNVVSIWGAYLFGSERIEYLEIPSSITYVDPFVFNGATIGTLVVKSIIPPVNRIAVFKQGISAIYVPDYSVNLYKNDNAWSEYADIIKPLSEKPANV